MKVARYKSGKYTIERPLHFGAALAQAPKDLIDTYSKYGIPLGDLLGVFGDPSQTGKPSGDDLREGKRTALIAIALQKANTSQQKIITDNLGDPGLTPSMISDLQQVITETGATSHIELMIEELTNTSLTALNHDGISQDGKKYLTELAVLATNRQLESRAQQIMLLLLAQG
jgi:geranylgeranyl diphosphate synthase type I